MLPPKQQTQAVRQGRDHWNQQVDPKEIGDRRGEALFQLTGGYRRSEEIAGGSPFGTTSSPEQSDRSSIPRQALSQIRKLLEANLEPAEQ